MTLSSSNRASAAVLLMSSKSVAIVLQLAFIPVCFKILGKDGNGFALWVMSVRSMMQLIDLDLPQGIRHIMMANARTDENRFWRSFQTGLTMNGCVGIVGGLLLGLGWSLLDGPQYDQFRSIMPVMFGLAALQMIVDSIGSTFSHPFYAKEEFAQLSISGAVAPSIALVFNFILVLVTRSPVAMLMAGVFESLLTMSITLYLFKKRFGLEHLRPGFDLTVATDVLRVGLKSYPGNISGRVAGTVDRVILGSVAGMDLLTIYNIATKIPQSLAQIVGSATSMMVPEMVHAAQNEPETFRHILRRNVSFFSVLYACAMVVSSGFAVVILKAWLRIDYPGFAELSILLAIYYALEMNFSTITTAFYAFKQAHLLFPFALWNAIVTVAATGPMSKKYGLMGLGWMNAFIDVVQIVPIHWLLTRTVVRDDSMWWYIRRLVSAIGAATVIAVGISWALRAVPVGREAAAFVVLMPVSSLGAFVVATRLRLVELPNSVREKLARRKLAVKLFGSSVLERPEDNLS
ncbi:MAG: lipopolysaccharide biosynthesis protein [Armatimonadota bacterium]